MNGTKAAVQKKLHNLLLQVDVESECINYGNSILMFGEKAVGGTISTCGAAAIEQIWPDLAERIAQYLAEKIAENPSAPKYHESAAGVLRYLNAVVEKNFRETDANMRFISARLSEPGVELDGVRAMIDRMQTKWGEDPKMCEYLRPATLFNATKFESYYAQRNDPVGGSVRKVRRGENI